MHYSFDYAQQAHYPSSPLQPGRMYYLVIRKYICGFMLMLLCVFCCVVDVGPLLHGQLLSVLAKFKHVEPQLVSCRCALSGVTHEMLEHHGSQAVVLDTVKDLRELSKTTSSVVQKVQEIYANAKKTPRHVIQLTTGQLVVCHRAAIACHTAEKRSVCCTYRVVTKNG